VRDDVVAGLLEFDGLGELVAGLGQLLDQLAAGRRGLDERCDTGRVWGVTYRQFGDGVVEPGEQAVDLADGPGQAAEGEGLDVPGAQRLVVAPGLMFE
jgi:hypothetical protein